MVFIIITGIIATIVGNFFIPSNISLFDIFEQIEIDEVSDIDLNNKLETFSESEEEYTPVLDKPTNTTESSKEKLYESSEKEINILPIKLTNKNVDNIVEQLLEISPIELSSYEGNITTDEQIDTYQFVPALEGRYRFEITDMLSGVKINIIVFNQAGEMIDYTSSGIENNDGLTIDNMVAGETYTIQIKQYSSYSSYKILIGLQKNTVYIDNGINQITDSIQYTDQKIFINLHRH